MAPRRSTQGFVIVVHLSIERATVKNRVHTIRVHTILIKLGITRRDQVAARLHT